VGILNDTQQKIKNIKIKSLEQNQREKLHFVKIMKELRSIMLECKTPEITQCK
jgi:hypothetical protein